MDLQREASDAHDAPPWPACLELSNGRSYGVDLVVSAIGVDVRSAWLPVELERCPEDGGVLVDACGSLLFKFNVSGFRVRDTPAALEFVHSMLCVSCLDCCVRVRPGGCCTCASACASLGLETYSACFVSLRMYLQPQSVLSKTSLFEMPARAQGAADIGAGRVGGRRLLHSARGGAGAAVVPDAAVDAGAAHAGPQNMAASSASPVYILQLTVQVSGLKLLSKHICKIFAHHGFGGVFRHTACGKSPIFAVRITLAGNTILCL